jgi:hypothetical protein
MASLLAIRAGGRVFGVARDDWVEWCSTNVPPDSVLYTLLDFLPTPQEPGGEKKKRRHSAAVTLLDIDAAVGDKRALTPDGFAEVLRYIQEPSGYVLPARAATDADYRARMLLELEFFGLGKHLSEPMPVLMETLSRVTCFGFNALFKMDTDEAVELAAGTSNPLSDTPGLDDQLEHIMMMGDMNEKIKAALKQVAFVRKDQARVDGMLATVKRAIRAFPETWLGLAKK